MRFQCGSRGHQNITCSIEHTCVNTPISWPGGMKGLGQAVRPCSFAVVYLYSGIVLHICSGIVRSLDMMVNTSLISLLSLLLDDFSSHRTVVASFNGPRTSFRYSKSVMSDSSKSDTARMFFFTEGEVRQHKLWFAAPNSVLSC